MAKLQAGRKPVDPKYHKLAYTQEQLDKLEAIRDPQFKLRVAKAEYVNKVLHPNGTVVDDTSGLKQALIDAAIAARDKATDAPSMMAAAVKFREAESLQDHLDQKRFLFVVDENEAPVIYFQCATPDNPDRDTFNGGE